MMSHDEPPSPSPLGPLTYRCQYCGQVVKPEDKAGNVTVANIVVIEPDGSVHKACRKCANLPPKVRRRTVRTSRN